jgi:glycerol-3-phosphate acyltransferase PlsY
MNYTFDDVYSKGFLGTYLEQTGTETGGGFFLLVTLGFLVASIIPYLLGSLNFAVILSKRCFHEDIRDYGSGNAGMTNMLRTYGTGPAALTLAGDALKAVLAVVIGRLIWGSIGAYVAGLCCVLGHVFPVFYKFKGGKGVVVTCVTILMTNWLVGVILISFFVLLVAATRFISLGSVMCALIYPLLLSRLNGSDPSLVLLFAIAIAAIVVIKHRTNIKRLIEGKENKISFSHKEKKSAADPAASEDHSEDGKGS